MNRGFCQRLCIGAATALLASCGGSQPPIGAPGAMPQSSASWMLPEARGRDLLYVSSSTYQYSTVYVYTFPGAKLVGGIVAGNYAGGLCSNAQGDVFVTDYYNVYEFEHGQARRVAVISDPLGAFDCSVNPINGDLAVGGFGGLTVFHHEKRHRWHLGRLYTFDLSEVPFCAYDGNGNLFFDGTLGVSSGSQPLFVELPHGGKQFENVKLNVKLRKPGNLAWDGKYLAVGDSDTPLIHRFAIRGLRGTQIGKLYLNGMQDVRQFAIHDGILIGPAFDGNWLFGLWRYPEGGSAQSTTAQDQAWGATVASLISSERSAR
ncbi:MAG TPA: hypothetical protein VHR97_11155 [Candidatus Baltobacteraceae bacterium]|jgi:hypothetical protein|nr:hypothetical protein [Candidatus Baltobacteraceae bacterium]